MYCGLGKTDYQNDYSEVIGSCAGTDNLPYLDKRNIINGMEGNKVSLDEVFSPRGVALAGASPSGGFATGVARGLQEAGFPNIYPVNPKYTEVFGLPCYASIRDIPGIVDHVVVSIPAEAALGLLDDCAAKGVRSVHFFTAGFSESGYAERAELEKAMLEKARAGNFRIIGPNCVGIYVPKSRLANGTGMPMEPGPVAFISQSGGHAHNLPLYGGPRGLRFSKVVSYGNALDVNESELMEYFGQDPDTETIAVYIEGVKDGRRFQRALRDAAAIKPVIIYKGGTTEAGKRATHGHTASLTSSVDVFNTLCRQMNAIQVDDMDELIDTLIAIHLVKPVPRGAGVAIVGAGGGPSVHCSDEMEKAGLYVPQLSTEVQEELKQSLPLAGSIFNNPIDTPNMASPQAISIAMRILSRVPGIDMLVYHMGFHPISRWGGGRFSSPAFLQPVIDTFREVQETAGKPVLLVMSPALETGLIKEFLDTQQAFVTAGFGVFHSMRQAARAMARLISWERV